MITKLEGVPINFTHSVFEADGKKKPFMKFDLNGYWCSLWEGPFRKVPKESMQILDGMNFEQIFEIFQKCRYICVTGFVKNAEKKWFTVSEICNIQGILSAHLDQESEEASTTEDEMDREQKRKSRTT
jgi:hypothetical protein